MNDRNNNVKISENEKVFKEYFELGKRKKEFQEDSVELQVPHKKGVLRKFRDLWQSESESVRVVSEAISGDDEDNSKYNLSQKKFYGNYGFDGSEGATSSRSGGKSYESDEEISQFEKERKKRADNKKDAAKKIAEEKIKKTVARTIIRSVFSYCTGVAGGVCVFLGFLAFLVFGVIYLVIWAIALI